MSLLENLKALHARDDKNYAPFMIDEALVGYVREDNAEYLMEHFPDVFQLRNKEIALNAALSDFSSRSDALKDVAQQLEADKKIAYPLKYEPFPVVTDWGEKPLMEIDRAVTPFFGLRTFGIHVNGYTYRDGEMHVWLGRRGAGVKVWPGKLDQMVAGGQPMGLSLEENMIKEGEEEAALPEEIMKQARACGALNYTMRMREGIRRDTQFVYDLELPGDVVPQADGAEVGEFICLGSEEALDLLYERDAFKPNCVPVLADFLIRHGVLTEENEPELQEIRRLLHGEV